MGGGPKRHHVIPESYLDRFADPKAHIVVARRGEKPFTTGTKNLGVVGQFYTVLNAEGNPSLEIEEYFSEVEGATMKLLREIVHLKFIPEEEQRTPLALYMALQLGRTPEMRTMLSLQEEIFGKMRFYTYTDDTIRRVLREMNGHEPTDAEFEQGKKVIESMDGVEVEVTSNGHLTTILKLAVEEIMPRLMEMEWRIVHSDERAFIVSDHPVVLYRESQEGANRLMGVGVSTADAVYFPIDPYHVLLLTPKPLGLPEWIEADTVAVHAINQLIANASYEWVAYHPRHHEPLKGITIERSKPPLLYVNGVAIFADGTGKERALAKAREAIETMKANPGGPSMLMHISNRKNPSEP